MKRILGAVSLMLSICSVSYAEQRRLDYQNLVFDHVWIFDDTRISAAQIEAAAELAPNLFAAAPDGMVLDWVFLARLEACVMTSPDTCEDYSRRNQGAEAFLTHAARNLQSWEVQMDRLRRQSFPAVLEPARSYVLQRMASAVEKERSRYGYLNSGTTADMQQYVCRACDCAALDPTLLPKLQAESNLKIKIELAAAWSSEVFSCEWKKHVSGYPLASWQGFLNEFGITEERSEGVRDAVPDDLDGYYDVVFDEARISASQMREIIWLSPYETGIVAPWLELCISSPSTPCERDPDVPDAAFLRNAAKNLERADEQVAVLLHMRIPQQLQPVRAYLLEQMLLSVDRERTRYEYLKSGDVAPLRTLLCRECECGSEDEALLGQLETEQDPKLRLRLSWYDWQNRVLACERKAHSQTYPLAAWEKFLQDFGIKEVGLK